MMPRRHNPNRRSRARGALVAAAVLFLTGVGGVGPAHAQASAATPAGPDMWDGGSMGGHGGHGMFGEGPGAMLPLLIRRTDLTPDQQARVRDIMTANHRSLRALFDELRSAQDGLVDKLLAPGPLDPKDLTAQTEHIVQLRQQLMDQGVKTALAVRAVLTPAQLAKAAETKDRLQKLRAEMYDLMGSE